MDKRSNGIEFFAGLIIGALVGAALAILLAPQSGEETLAQLRDKGQDLKNTAGELASDAKSKTTSQALETVSKMKQRNNGA